MTSCAGHYTLEREGTPASGPPCVSMSHCRPRVCPRQSLSPVPCPQPWDGPGTPPWKGVCVAAPASVTEDRSERPPGRKRPATGMAPHKTAPRTSFRPGLTGAVTQPGSQGQGQSSARPLASPELLPRPLLLQLPEEGQPRGRPVSPLPRGTQAPRARSPLSTARRQRPEVIRNVQ